MNKEVELKVLVTAIVDSASRNELPPKVSGLVLRSRLMTSVI